MLVAQNCSYGLIHDLHVIVARTSEKRVRIAAIFGKMVEFDK